MKIQKLGLAVLAVAVALPVKGFAGLKYEGSQTIGGQMLPDLAKALEAKKGVKLDSISTGGSGKALDAVMGGSADIGGLSRALKAEEKAKKPYYQTIAYDAVGVFVNGGNSVKNLSKDQVKGIFTGKIMNWKEVGGKDGKIEVVVLHANHGTTQDFVKDALDGAAFGAAQDAGDGPAAVSQVASKPNAITFASISVKSSGVNAVSINNVAPVAANIKSGSYTLSRPLILISNGLPKGDTKTLFDFVLSPDGQAVVGKYFVPVK